MFLGRVVGTVIATRKVEGLDGIRMLLVVPVDSAGRDVGAPLVAADTTQAGVGDIVHLTGSREASLALPTPFVPVDAAILSIVDSVDGRDAQPNAAWSGPAYNADAAGGGAA